MTHAFPTRRSSDLARGNALRLKVDTGTFAAGNQQAAPLLVTAVVHDPDTGAATLFALNRSIDEEMNLTAELRNMGARRLDAASELHHADLEAINTSAAPDREIGRAHV